MKRVRGGILLALALSLGVASLAGAVNVSNGGFERGDLSEWKTSHKPSSDLGAWSVYAAPTRARGVVDFVPPQGKFGAITDQDSCSSQVLHRTVELPANRRHSLRFSLAYLNEHTRFSTPKSYSTGGCGPPARGVVTRNQQFRVDVLKASAGVRSMKDADILREVFRTDVGEPNGRNFAPVRANLTPFAGRKVRLRFSVMVTEGELYGAIDNVRIRTRPLDEPQ